jgi:hypothetical protein
MCSIHLLVCLTCYMVDRTEISLIMQETRKEKTQGKLQKKGRNGKN